MWAHSTKQKVFCLVSLPAPSSPTGCLWANTTWLRKSRAPRPSCLRRLLSMKNGTKSLWPSGMKSITVQYKSSLCHLYYLLCDMLKKSAGAPFHLFTSFQHIQVITIFSTLKHAAGQLQEMRLSVERIIRKNEQKYRSQTFSEHYFSLLLSDCGGRF